jgi:uncharacterized protein
MDAAGATMTQRRDLDEPEQFFIDKIRQQPPDGGEMVCGEMVEELPGATVWNVSYRSQELRISGLMAQPHGTPPFPSVIINHGFFPPEDYYSGKGSRHELRALAQRGYLTIAPDYRNYGDSDDGDNIFQPGYLHDVRNLMPALAELPQTDETRIAIMGHSMGAGLTLQTLATSEGFRAAALLGSVTGREAERYEARLTRWPHGSGAAARGLDTFSDRYGTPATAPASFDRMSVINYLDAVDVPIIMHHGSEDQICPLQWATEIYECLASQGNVVDFHLYPDAGHVFRDSVFDAMIERTDRFFRTHMDIAN